MMRAACFWAALAALCVCGEAKGSAGARSGGGYRNGRSGVYSRGYMYSYGYFYMYGGVGRSRRSSRGGSAPDPNSENKVFCRRDVRVDLPRYTDSTMVPLNSTRLCYQQASSVRGAPQNTKIESILLDVYQFNFEAGRAGSPRYPAVAMSQIDDKDNAAAVPKSRLRWVLRDLVVLDDGNTVVATHDLRSLEWKAVTAAPADKPVFGWPTSTQRDQTKLTSFAIEASSAAGDLKVALVFTVSDDFAEVPFADRLFFRPSAVGIRLVVEKFPFTSKNSRIGVNAVLGFNETLPHVVAKPPGTSYGAAYNPTQMDRVEIGSVADTEQRGRHYFSWRRSANSAQLCLKLAPLQCPNGIVPRTPVVVCSTPAARATAECQQLGLQDAGVKGLRLEFLSNVTSEFYGGGGGDGVASTLSAHKVTLRPHFLDWSLTLGTFDAGETFAPEPVFEAAGVVLPQWLALAAAALLMVLA